MRKTKYVRMTIVATIELDQAVDGVPMLIGPSAAVDMLSHELKHYNRSAREKKRALVDAIMPGLSCKLDLYFGKAAKRP